MINTVAIKGQQLVNGYFEIGSGEQKILIMGSCRVAPYVEYLNKWNAAMGDWFTIYSVDPFNFNWNKNDERTDYETELLKWEKSGKMLAMFNSVDIFIHEYYQNSGMFNVNKEDNKTIYHFGMNPKIDVCLPNFNDCFIMFKDIVNFDIDIRKKAMQDMNVLSKISKQTLDEIYEVSKKGLQKFYDVCMKSDLPEMKQIVEDNFKNKRFWWSYNHVSKNFTMAIFNLLCKKYLNISLPENFYYDKEDMFANNYTYLTQYDLDYYGYEWGEELKPIL